ncbi:MAG: hypothetical protein V3R81_00005, partial [Gammaproteobacteria bacterium]
QHAMRFGNSTAKRVVIDDQIVFCGEALNGIELKPRQGARTPYDIDVGMMFSKGIIKRQEGLRGSAVVPGHPMQSYHAPTLSEQLEVCQ